MFLNQNRRFGVEKVFSCHQPAALQIGRAGRYGSVDRFGAKIGVWFLEKISSRVTSKCCTADWEGRARWLRVLLPPLFG